MAKISGEKRKNMSHRFVIRRQLQNRVVLFCGVQGLRGSNLDRERYFALIILICIRPNISAE